jgi:putative ABC transport system permease protein
MKLAIKLFWRELVRGKLNVMLAGIALSVGVVLAIAWFAESISATFEKEAGALLAADAQIRSNQEISDVWRETALELNLSTSESVNFQTMSISEDGLQLASVTAVDSAYPLAGSVKLADQAFGIEFEVRAAPQAGQAWVASRLLSLLNLKVGDSIAVGNADFVVDKALVASPESSGGASFTPPILVNLEDLESIGALQFGSRASYKLLVSGSESALAQLAEQVENSEQQGLRWRSARESDERLTETLDRAERFLLLAASFSVALAGVALAANARQFTLSQVIYVGVFKTLGYGPKAVLKHYLIIAALILCVGLVLGLVFGEGLKLLILTALSELLPETLVSASYMPIVLAMLTGVVAVVGFILPPFLNLRKLAPMAVLRELSSSELLKNGVWPGVISLLSLMMLFARDPLIVAAIAVGAVLVLLGVGLLGGLLIALTRQWSKKARGGMRIGLANLYRERSRNAMLLSIFSVTLLLVFTLSLIERNLLDDWQQQLPADAPNHFVFNVFPDQVEGLEDWMQVNQVTGSPLYPIQRGRMLQINGVSSESLLAELPESGDLLRELNMTWSDRFGADNQLVEGDWWPELPNNRDLSVSLEQSFAERANISLGDNLTFNVGGIDLRAVVTSIRSVSWNSLSPNFYAIFDRPLLEGAGSTGLISFYLPPQNKAALASLIRQNPTFSVIEIDVVLQQVQDIIAQVSLAIRFILMLVLASGVLVMIASLQTTMPERRTSVAILRALGAGGSMVRLSLFIEFLMLALIACFIAAVGAEAIVALLQSQLFELAFVFHGMQLLVLLAGATAFLTLSAMSMHLPLLRVPPMHVLRS